MHKSEKSRRNHKKTKIMRENILRKQIGLGKELKADVWKFVKMRYRLVTPESPRAG